MGKEIKLRIKILIEFILGIGLFYLTFYSGLIAGPLSVILSIIAGFSIFWALDDVDKLNKYGDYHESNN